MIEVTGAGVKCAEKGATVPGQCLSAVLGKCKSLRAEFQEGAESSSAKRDNQPRIDELNRSAQEITAIFHFGLRGSAIAAILNRIT
jgi:hypothetical protein